jgi:site-specific DNA-methyltransferase (adenine-specific)
MDGLLQGGERVSDCQPYQHYERPVGRSVDWETPQEVFDQLNKEFHFNLDVAASAENAKCAEYFTKEQDGLTKDWTGRRCWMNPPYGVNVGKIDKWIKKACETAKQGLGSIIVCLVPVRTATHWWQRYAMQASEIRLVYGRLKFGNDELGGGVLRSRPRF